MQPHTMQSWCRLVHGKQLCVHKLQTDTFSIDVEALPCKEDSCSGNGQCFYDDNGMRYCSCDRGYTGNDCSSAIVNSCEPNPCHSRATCEELQTSFKCHCPPHKKGTLCRDGKLIIIFVSR